MDKNAVLGELLFILANYEKGRIKSSGYWWRKDVNSLKKSVDIMQTIINLLQNPHKNFDDMILSVVDFVKENSGVIFPLRPETLEQWEKDRFILVSDISIETKYCTIIKLMNEITDEIMFLLNKRGKKYKLKISYLLFALHNLPKVYLNNGTETLCNIGIPPISIGEALQYSSSYLKSKDNL